MQEIIEIRLEAEPSPNQSKEDKHGALTRLLDGLDKNSSHIRLWIEDVQPKDDAMAADHGFTPYRDLWQLTCALPLSISAAKQKAATDLQVRAFAPQDIEAFLKVQNRAFAWHPEEADMDESELQRRIAEPWFEEEDFLLLEESSIIGFCWTKVHKDSPDGAQILDQTQMLGEIYMIGVDPDHQGRSLGELLCIRGFEHLSAKGIKNGMLYVESDNHAGNAIYRRIGMKLSKINRAYTNQPA